MGKITWTAELDARLTALHRQGVSFAGIAEQLSAEFRVRLTKNAAIGRSHRLTDPNQPKAIRPKRPVQTVQTVQIVPEIEPEVIKAPPKGWTVTVPEPVQGRVTIWELRQGICHYPLGERPPYAYCGLKTPVGPYCLHHRRVMYGPRVGAR